MSGIHEHHDGPLASINGINTTQMTFQFQFSVNYTVPTGPRTVIEFDFDILCPGKVFEVDKIAPKIFETFLMHYEDSRFFACEKVLEESFNYNHYRHIY